MNDPGSPCACLDCGLRPPETEHSYGILAPQHGWRLYRRTDSTGRFVADWRCPACWQVFRARLAADAAAPFRAPHGDEGWADQPTPLERPTPIPRVRN